MAPPSFFPSSSTPSCSTSTITVSPAYSSSTGRSGKISRSSSSRSDLSCDLRRWKPSESIALTGVAGKEGKGKVLGKENMGDAERGLSSLYVGNERLSGTKPPSKQKKGWGGTLVDGAMNAGVFGAALGLTAYRLWSSDDKRDSPPSATCLTPMTSPSLSSGSSAAHSSIRSRPDSIEFFPPPAYSASTVYPVQLSTKDEDQAWVDIDTLFDIPAHRRSVSKTTPPKYIRNKRLSRQRARMPMKSWASMTVEDLLPHEQSPCPLRVKPPEEKPALLKTMPVEEDTQEQVVDPGEILDRLDSISEQLRTMVEEGRRALASTSPAIPFEGWVDEGGMTGQQISGAGRAGSQPRAKTRRRKRENGSS